MNVMTLMLLVIALFIGIWIESILFAKYYMDLKKFAPEAIVFKTARKKKLAIIELSDTVGRTIFILGTKRKRSDIHFRGKGSEYGIQIDPKLQGSVAPSMLVDGVQLHHFNTKFPFSMGDKNARALIAIVDHARQKFPDLNFLTDADILIFAKMAKDNLDDNVDSYMTEFEPEVERTILNEEFTLSSRDSIVLNCETIEELSNNGINIGYKPLLEIGKIKVDKTSQKVLVTYLKETFENLNLDKPIITIPQRQIFNWRKLIQ